IGCESCQNKTTITLNGYRVRLFKTAEVANHPAACAKSCVERSVGIVAGYRDVGRHQNVGCRTGDNDLSIRLKSDTFCLVVLAEVGQHFPPNSERRVETTVGVVASDGKIVQEQNGINCLTCDDYTAVRLNDYTHCKVEEAKVSRYLTSDSKGRIQAPIRLITRDRKVRADSTAEGLPGDNDLPVCLNRKRPGFIDVAGEISRHLARRSKRRVESSGNGAYRCRSTQKQASQH